MQTYARKPVLFVRGEGMRLYDDDGREYLDFVSGIGAVNLGHAHPAVTAAVAEQAGKLVHVSNLYYVEHRAELACELVRLMGGGMRVFFANSGAEANEGAIKLARKWAGQSQAGRVTSIVTRSAVLPRPHAGDARRHRPAQQAGGVRAAARGLRARAAQRHRRPGRRGRRVRGRGPARGRAGRGRRVAGVRGVPRWQPSGCAASATCC